MTANADGKALLLTIRLSPWGVVQTTNGAYVMDDEAAAAIVAAFAKHGTALPIDREHETLPENTPAAGSRGAVGWIEEVYAEPGNALMGKVRWTDEGRALIRAEAFRYLSPVLMVRKSDRRAVSLHSAAMTNKPAIPKMDRLAASQTAQATNVVIHPVPASDADQQAHAARMALVASRDAEVARAVREHFSLKRDAGREAVVVALANMSNDGERVAKLERELAAMKDGENKRRVDALMEAEYVAGRVIRGTMFDTEARKLAENDPDAFTTLVSSRKPIVEQGATKPPSDKQEYRWNAMTDIRDAYLANRTTQKLTSLVDFAEAELKSRNMPPLRDYEREDLEQFAARQR